MIPKDKLSEPSSGEACQLLTTEEAAEFLRMKPRSLATMRCQGKGPPYIKTGIILYELTDLEEWINEKRQTFATVEPSPGLGNQNLRKAN